MKKTVVAAIFLLMLLVQPIQAQTVTSVIENNVITGTGFAAGDTVTASPSGTACTNVVVVSATQITATCPDGTVTVTVKAPAPTTFPYVLCANACNPTPPTSLTFSGTVGAAAPVAQTLSIFDTSSCPAVPPVPYCAWPGTTVTTDSSWLKVSVPSGTTQFSDAVSVVLTGLAAGTYKGNVIITQKLFTTPTLKVPVTLTVAPASNGCTLVPANTWTNLTFPTQTANFELVVTVTPSAADMDGLVALSSAAATTDNGTSVPALFGTTGFVQMLNSAFPYPTSTAASYTAAGTYTLTFDVNMTNHTYNGYVNGIQVATNYAFRTAAGTPASLGFLSVFQDVGTGTLNVCNVTINPYPVPVQHSVALTWTPGSGGTPATSFIVQRAATTAGPFTQIAAVTAASYTDPNVTSGSPYCYDVIGVAGTIQSVPSNALCVSIPGASSKRSLWKKLKKFFT